MKPPFDRSRLLLYFWMAVAYLLLATVSNSHSHQGWFFPALVNSVWRMAYVTALNFVFFEYTVPYVLRKRRYAVANVLAGLLLLFIHAMLWSLGLYVWRLVGIGVGVFTPLGTFDSTGDIASAQMAFSTGSVFFFGIVRHFYNYQKLKAAAQRLRIEKQEAELNYLKSQTNPHFLFNTLNNIYSLARDKSEKAPESILRLSKILRFMLYEAGGDYVSIEQEMKIIDDYIALEKLRYDESLRVDFAHNVEDIRQSVPPLLLMPLVENAFKHGVSETRNRPFVDIHLSVRQRQLAFVVKNSTGDGDEGPAVKENIGLSNLRRQLQLLYTDCDLTVQREAATFTATLKINLASHA